MKKFLVLFLLISVSFAALAQMGKVTSASSFISQQLLDKAKEALDLALVNEKSKDNPNTYLVLGDLCREVFKSENPKFKALYANPLEDAFTAYEKALKLDTKGNVEKKMKIQSTYMALGNDFITQGVQKFEAKDYQGALSAFEYNIKISESPIYIGVVDSAIYLNAGLSAYNGNLYDKAIPYFKKCTELKYGGTQPYSLMYLSYMGLKDITNAEATLKKAFEVYPDDQQVVLQLADYYMNNNKLQEAFSYISLAKSKDPNNYSLFWAEGVLYMKQDKWDDAIKCLQRSIELKSDQYDTQFNLGVCFYNKAVEMFKQAETIMDVNKYNEAIKPANSTFENAIPYFEKASTLNPKDVDSLKNLKELYFRLRTIKPEYEAKYNEIVKKLEGK
jgi:tetratricopeptide (TPR) repeat protein